ncbi:MAG: FMN-binding negative transcriptional regulator [Bacteriovorax sp.]
MKHYPMYVQENEAEVERFVQSMPMCLFSTYGEDSKKMGVFNPVYKDGIFSLHLNKSDEQFKAMLNSNGADLIFFDFLCNVPSYWVDEQNGGAATSYYRYAEFKCAVKTYSSAEDVARKIGCFLEKYQAEGGYSPIEKDSPIYQSSLKLLGIVELKPIEVITKWKLGQNRPVEKRLEIIEKLKKRNEKEDLRAAMEVKRWMIMNQ